VPEVSSFFATDPGDDNLSVRLRLTRVGAKKNPIWRVVVADQRSPRDGRVIETIGRYNPQTEPSTVIIDTERAQAWIGRGAQPTRAVAKLLRIQEAGSGTAALTAASTVEAVESAASDEAADADTAVAVAVAVAGDSAPEATADAAVAEPVASDS
jgi:small subunit ribosomal protein S16